MNPRLVNPRLVILRRFVLPPRSVIIASVIGVCVFGIATEPAPSMTRAPKQSASVTASSRRSASSTSAKKASTKKKRKRVVSHKRLLRIHQAFVASATLRPMAQQLLRERTPAGYAGVEGYARKHATEDAGSLAWLVAGYAHTLDHDPGKAIDPLKRAQANAGDLAEYVTYFLATAYQQNGTAKQAELMLRDFDEKYPGSILTRDARVTRANALIEMDRAAEAVALLEADRQPARADVEVVLGRAYAMTGQTAKAGTALRAVYYTMPLSTESETAEKELLKLAGKIPAASFAERKTRADLLAKGKRYGDAVTEYRTLLGDASPQERPWLDVALGAALRQSGHGKDARQMLEQVNATGELNAQRLYHLGEIEKSNDEESALANTLAQLREGAPASTWLEQALLSAANYYLIRKDYEKAQSYFHELAERFAGGTRASSAHWKAAWLLWRTGNGVDARREFERQIQLFPEGGEAPAAMYWRGRAAEEDGDLGRARAYYEKLSHRYLNFYYAVLARERLKGDVGKATLVSDAVLDHLTRPESWGNGVFGDPPADDLRVQKARLLANGALLDFALRELQVAAAEDDGNWETAEMARVCQDAGRYDRSIDVVKHAVPIYFALPLNGLPQSYWQALFPRPFWVDLKTHSQENGLDPFLVASLVRQESAFNPSAISHANAIGLMQLLPSTGHKVARDLGVRHFSNAMLTVPATNLRLGTRFFKGMVNQFGSVEYALAAYNAGGDRVQEWMAAGKYRDTAEFVESIPFTETREYVQAIMRNAGVYRQLYGAP